MLCEEPMALLAGRLTNDAELHYALQHRNQEQEVATRFCLPTNIESNDPNAKRGPGGSVFGVNLPVLPFGVLLQSDITARAQ